MARPSKERRKQMRRDAEQSLRIQEFLSWVVSTKATQEDAGPKQILADAAAVGVRLDHQAIDDETHAFGVPGAIDQFAVIVGYGTLTPEVLLEAERYELLCDDPDTIRAGLPAICFRAKVNLDPVIDFLHQTMLRILGRLTQGSLISSFHQAIFDDWLSWSLDYMDADMFKVTRVYDDPPPDFSVLLKRFPQLRS